MPTYVKKPRGVDVPALASRLPRPLQKPAAMLGSLAKDFLGGDEPDISQLGPAAPLTTIPMWKLSNALKSGMADELLETVKSPVLKRLVRPNEETSSEVASALSGLRPASSLTRYVPPRFQSSYADRLVRQEPASAFRQASEEMYRITQKALERLGISPGEEVDLWRKGPVPKTPYLLTPTHIDPEYAGAWRGHRGSQFNKFSVPREHIRALVGLLKRGDDLTLGEALVPARKLAEAAELEAPIIAEPEFLQWNRAPYVRTPRWFKKQVLK